MAATTSSFHQTGEQERKSAAALPLSTDAERLDASFPITSDYDDTPTKSGSASQGLTDDLSATPQPALGDGSGRNGVESNGAESGSSPRPAEDPLEAIDALDDAIEEVGRSLPSVAEDGGHDNSTRSSSSFNHETEATQTQTPVKRMNSSRGPTTKRNSVAKTPALASSKPMPTTHSRVGSRTDSGLNSRSPAKGSNDNQPPDGSSKLAVHKPAFVPGRSSKPATHPTFELPGEAISRRKREKIEEQRRKEEEETQQRRAFKAREIKYEPGRSASVRETASSRARANRSSQVIDPQAVTPQRKLTTPTSAGRNSRASASVDGETGGRDAQTTSTSPSSIKSPGAPSGGAPSDTKATTTSTKKVGAVQSTKGKEIFRRERAEREEKREKGEAAKRARAEAAERSRQLGRAFAEKQRQKTQGSSGGKSQ